MKSLVLIIPKSDLNALLHRNLYLVMAVAVAGAEVAGADQHQVGQLLQGVDEEKTTEHQYLSNRHFCYIIPIFVWDISGGFELSKFYRYVGRFRSQYSPPEHH